MTYQAVIVNEEAGIHVTMPWARFPSEVEAKRWCTTMNAKHVPADGVTRFDYEEIPDGQLPWD